MYSKFSNFRGQTLAGGASLGPKTGTCVGWGIDKIFAGWEDPPVPPRKKTQWEKQPHVAQGNFAETTKPV